MTQIVTRKVKAELSKGGGRSSSVGVNTSTEIDIIKDFENKIFTNENVLSSLRTLVEIQKIIVKTNDSIEYTDNNTLSSVKVLEEINTRINELYDQFLSKTKPDSASELITFLKGLKSNDLVTLLKGLHVEGGANIDNLHVLEAIAAKLVDAVRVSATNADIQQANIVNAVIKRIQSAGYTSGPLGSGLFLGVDENGDSRIEVNNALIRKEAIFNKLTIAEMQSVGGQIVLSIANMECLRVESIGEAYRCYFDNQNGTITNKFALYDQARCQTFDGAKMKYYWRLVVGVGTDYIDLSKTDKDGLGIPEARDSIVQLGNRVDKSRQNAIILSAYGVPSIKQYDNIHSYSLDGCEVTVISPEGNKLVGDLSVVSGNKVVRVPADRGPFTSGEPYFYYDRVSHNGALWLCLVEEGKSTTTEPSANNPIWKKQVREGQDTVYVQVITDKGNIMLNGQTETTLTAVVYRGEENITDQIAPNFFSWERTSANPAGDIIFNESHKGYGKTLVVTSEDVIRRTQFDCIVNINF